MKWYLTLVCFSILGGPLNARPSEEETCKQLCKQQAESQTILLGKEKDQFTKCLHGCLSSQNTVEFSRSLYKEQNYPDKANYISDRTKRAAGKIPRKRSCNSTASSDFVGIVNNVTIDFQKTSLDVNGSVADHWTAVIRWSPLTDKKTANLWTHYIVQWRRDRHALCKLVAKNVTSLVLNNRDDWQYPHLLELNVSTYPLNADVYYRFSIWRDPRPLPKLIPVTPPAAVSAEQLAIILIGCSVGFVLVVIATMAWIFKGRISARLARREREHDADSFEYDASIIYSNHDKEFVTKTLLPMLEGKYNFRCFIHYRDWEVGRVIHENMADTIYKSRYVIAVMSKDFLKSNFCKEELDMALDRVIRYRDSSLKVINLDGINKENFPRALRNRTYIDLSNQHEERTWEKRLARQISHEEEERAAVNNNREDNAGEANESGSC